MVDTSGGHTADKIGKSGSSAWDAGKTGGVVDDATGVTKASDDLAVINENVGSLFEDVDQNDIGLEESKAEKEEKAEIDKGPGILPSLG